MATLAQSDRQRAGRMSVRAELQPHAAADRSDGPVGHLSLDWMALGARIRQVAMAASAIHLIEAADGAEKCEPMLETSRAKPGG